MLAKKNQNKNMSGSMTAVTLTEMQLPCVWYSGDRKGVIEECFGTASHYTVSHKHTHAHAHSHSFSQTNLRNPAEYSGGLAYTKHKINKQRKKK